MTLPQAQPELEPELFEKGTPSGSKSAKKVASDKAPGAYRTISEVATELEVPQHVLRFWETKFTQLKPLKRGGGRRYYRADDIKLLGRIHTLLYSEGYTIKGAQKALKDERGKFALPKPVLVAKEEQPVDKKMMRELLRDLRALRVALV
jgi:DNA-binding transcriptional MerR regulator